MISDRTLWLLVGRWNNRADTAEDDPYSRGLYEAADELEKLLVDNTDPF